MIFPQYLSLYLAEQSELVVWKKAVSFIKEKISSNKLFEAPVLALNKSIGSLAFCKGAEKKNVNVRHFIVDGCVICLASESLTRFPISYSAE